MLKKVLCTLLSSVLLLSASVSCAQTDDPSGETSHTADSVMGNDTASDSDADTKETLDIPDTKYDGQILTFLTRDDEAEWTTHEIYAAEMTSATDNINNAVYERNLKILDTYGITVRELKESIGKHVSKVNTEISASSGDFSAIISNVTNSASMATNGALWNLHSDAVRYMDFSKSWWDTEMAAGMSIQNMLYFATGDLLTSDNDATFCILFNKEIVEDNKIEDLYALTQNNQWTMDKFYEISSACVRELDGTPGLAGDKDICGFAYTSSAPTCFYFGGNITLCQKDETDTPVYGIDIERASNITEMGKKIFDQSHAIDLQSLNDPGGLPAAGKITFGGNHALFIAEVMQTVTRMRGYDVNFGILPIPMYDGAQGHYSSMMHSTASVVSIPKTVTGESLEMTAAMIEAMAYHSVDTLTKQYYEINLKTRDSKDEKSGPMMDMILANRICDLSYYFGWGRGAYAAMAETMLPSTKASVASLNQRFSSVVTSDIGKVVEKFAQAEQEAGQN